ncbi:hypothetical protein F3L20_24360 [Streptomyces tendae]|uniref:Uncharacterized protein n=1 Tax=Streptomyces tendae TaxID=1932 RepID=A0ABX5ZV64_STRTE|nr:hypothetical protein F3L20_24360 [Streptomyces tendae]
MPSVTVVVSSDTDIYISPGLYGDCLPTVATGGTADSFRAGRVISSPRSSCSHTPCGAETVPCRGLAGMNGRPPRFTSHGRYGHRQSDVNRL